MPRSVVVLGGGVAGLTAAHELAERGFAVSVYEAAEQFGGKAKSNRKPGSGVGSRDDLPGEHGFRFFPGFYRHVPDTMSRIPRPGGGTVFDNLVATRQFEIARDGEHEILFPTHLPFTPWQLWRAFRRALGGLGIHPGDLRLFARRLLVLLISCRARRFAEYERIGWTQFAEPDRAVDPPTYEKYFGHGLTRTLVAAQARKISARTAGYILLQLLFDMVRPGVQVDRVLNAPTNDAWIEPWLARLESLDVELHPRSAVQRLNVADGRIASVTVVEAGVERTITADFFVAALPVEVWQQLVTPELTQLEPALDKLARLPTEWMVGIQFYLSEPLAEVFGHTLYIDSQWALTSISQQPFWRDVDLSQVGDGRIAGILSVDVSDWNTAGASGFAARHAPDREAIQREVWEQLKGHLNDSRCTRLRDDMRVDWFLDPAVEQITAGEAPVWSNREPLLINAVGSWTDRPTAVTRIPNLFLAGDFVQTNTDLATMESANEAARRAVNGLLDAAGSPVRRCRIWQLEEPWIFAPLRWYDARRFRLGLGPSRLVLLTARLVFLPLWILTYVFWWLFWRAGRAMRMVK